MVSIDLDRAPRDESYSLKMLQAHIFLMIVFFGIICLFSSTTSASNKLFMSKSACRRNITAIVNFVESIKYMQTYSDSVRRRKHLFLLMSILISSRLLKSKIRHSECSIIEKWNARFEINNRSIDIPGGISMNGIKIFRAVSTYTPQIDIWFNRDNLWFSGRYVLKPLRPSAFGI